MQERLVKFPIRKLQVQKRKGHSLKSKEFIPPPIRKEYNDFLPEDYDLAYMLSDLDRFYEFAVKKGYSMERIDKNQKLSDRLWGMYYRHYNYPDE